MKILHESYDCPPNCNCTPTPKNESWEETLLNKISKHSYGGTSSEFEDKELIAFIKSLIAKAKEEAKPCEEHYDDGVLDGRQQTLQEILQKIEGIAENIMLDSDDSRADLKIVRFSNLKQSLEELLK